MTVRFRVGDSLELAADVEGVWSGHLVLLLHGGGQTKEAWGSTVSMLGNAGFLVISLDLRGHGRSDWAPDGDYSFNAYARDLRAVVDHIGQPVALVGYSLGGLISLIAAGEAPRVSCTAIILVDVVPRFELKFRDHIVEFMRSCPDGFTSIEEAASAVGRYLPHRARPADVSGLAKNLRLGPDGRYRWHWDPALLDERLRDQADDLERFERAALAVHMPLMLVRGGMSELVSEAGVDAFRRLVPSAEYVDVQEADHMVTGDRNQVFASAILSFLSRKICQPLKSHGSSLP